MSTAAEALPYPPDDAFRHLLARFALAANEKDLDKMRSDDMEYRARLLILAGCTIIPSDHLRDNEFVVSREMFEAARRVSLRDAE